jgi:phenylalanyl-tRNA synthetase beta chain
LGVDMAAALIKESSPSSKIGKIIDIKSEKIENTKIKYSYDKINNLIGTKLSQDEIESLLTRLDIKTSDDIAEIPSYRFYDLKIWQDLAEEVARIYGYNKIERISPKNEESKAEGKWQQRESIKDVLKNIGFTESYSYSFTDKDKMELLGEKIENFIEIVNPMSPETQYLREGLAISLLKSVAKNPWAPEINIFEIEKVFNTNEEKWQLGIATVGKSDNLIKQAIQAIGTSFEIVSIDQKILDVYKIRRPLNIAIINFDETHFNSEQINNEMSKNIYRQISKYPPTIFDLAFVVDMNIVSSEIEKSILGASSSVLLTEKFDEFNSDKLGQGKKSMAFHIWLQNTDGPVDDNEVKKIRENVIKIVELKYQSKLRS